MIKQKWIPGIFLCLIAFALSFIGCEIYLRSKGYGWIPEDAKHFEPIVFESDKELGWINRPGDYIVPIPHGNGNTFHVKVLDDHFRNTGSTSIEPLPEIWLVGCSYIYGWGVNDEETLDWQIQKAYPHFRVRNMGVSGYGTFQSLIALERQIQLQKALPNHATTVIYGFNEFHLSRNTNSPTWLRAMNLSQSGRNISIPYCLINPDGKLVRHAPESYPWWPFRSESSLMTFIQDRALRTLQRDRIQQYQPVTLRLIDEMQSLCQKNGFDFHIFTMTSGDETYQIFRSHWDQQRISYFDGRDSRSDKPDYLVPGDGHPNRLMHEIWAKKIIQWKPWIPVSKNETNPSIP